MVQHFPNSNWQSGSRSVAAEFAQRVGEIVVLDELIACFSRALALEGGAGHACYALEAGKRTLLFGDTKSDFSAFRQADAVRAQEFLVMGWDQRPYVVEMCLPEEFDTRERKASLHTMAVTYLCRLLAILEADSAPFESDLTETERRCLELENEGFCDLDVGEKLGISVHAVQICRDRAKLKAACKTD